MRGFFIKNHAFQLSEKAATIIAQIACFNDVGLPQGSPCSPIIADLIAHVLDVRLARMARAYTCTYSRYADDITFSTNQKTFPEELAAPMGEAGTWTLGAELTQRITDAGFIVNNAKTRMQFKTSRQLVTGLTVNKKVNIRADYSRAVRAMCDNLFANGTYYWPNDETQTELNDLRRLEGALNHIDHVRSVSKSWASQEDKNNKKSPINEQRSRNGFTKLFGEFLFFKTFVNLNKPLVLCEGLTDGIYLKAALRSLANSYPKLVEKVADHYENKISFFRYTERTDKVLRLGGGAGGIKNFVTHYGYTFKRFEFAPKKYPVIVLSDNDDAAKGLFSFVNSNTGQQISQKSTADFYHVIHNLYVIKTPEIGQNGSSCIEDLFDKSVLDIPVAGKKFSANETIDTNKEFGKTVFAEKVIVPNAKKIDFTQFAAVFDRINAVIEHYKAP